MPDFPNGRFSTLLPPFFTHPENQTPQQGVFTKGQYRQED
jgi:hypothetical protein